MDPEARVSPVLVASRALWGLPDRRVNQDLPERQGWRAFLGPRVTEGSVVQRVPPVSQG